MKTLLAGIAALGVAGLVHAHPLVIEESSRIAPPPGVDALWGDVALDGNDAVALSSYSYLDEGGEDYITITSAWLYRRSGTTWTLVRKVGESDDNSIDDATNRNPIAMKNGVLALAFEPMYILEREGGNWVQKQIGASTGPAVSHSTSPSAMSKLTGGEYSSAAGAGAAPSTRRIPSPATGWLAPLSTATTAETTTTPSVATSTSRRTGRSWRVRTT